MAVTNAVSWRSEGIKHRKNEIFLDVVERLCSHIGILHRGAFQAVGRPAELVEAARVASLEALFLDLTAQ